ncbi:MAG TPA: ABC transporter substrate-binding protein [Chloroflexota bacterium]|nr:ABC transporter substrate-binding protein [Chloroflexota bacterium]
MTLPAHATVALKALAAALLVTMIAAVPAAQAARPTAVAAPPLTTTALNLPFTRNFNPFAPAPPYGLTLNGIYEPLYVVSFVAQKQVPWLATGYSWSKDLKTLTFTIRKGVRWSDGQPLTPKDVVFSLTMGQKNSAINPAGLWGPAGLATSVTSSGTTASIHFKTPDVTTFAGIVNNQMIVPEHIWARIPAKSWNTWTNPNPIGSGPFTQVKEVSSDSYLVGRNPYYWQPLYVPAIRVIGYNGNDPQNLDLESGKIDWSGAFIPDADKLCEGKGMGCHHYFSTKSVPVMLYFNDAKYPYNLPAFRQAVSMALNRLAFDNNAEYGYEPPSHITGLNGQWANWIDKSVSNAAATYDPTAARNMLKKAGFKMQGGHLLDPKGHRVAFDVYVVAGWTDWIAMDQIISQNLKVLGIDANPKPLQYGDYFSRESNGRFDATISWSCSGDTPYGFYDGEAGAEHYRAIGTATTAGCNFERYTNPRMNTLLEQFRATLDSGQQHALVNQMQRIWVQDLPAIPMVIGAQWYEWNPTHYTGWPTQSNYYVQGSTWAVDRLVIFPRLRPTGH